jgi:hypothetical protein
VDDGLDQRPCAVVAGDVGHQLAVQLDDADREPAEVDERRVTPAILTGEEPSPESDKPLTRAGLPTTVAKRRSTLPNDDSGWR